MDHPNYARYLTAYFLLLLNLNESHPGAEELLRNKGFSVCRSSVPGARNAVDMTIEQTINRHAKSKGGIIGFSRNIPAYHRWCVTRHKRASYVSALLGEAGLDNSNKDAHKDLQQSQMKQSEEDVQRVVTSFSTFINPFDVVQTDYLVSVSSGMKAPADVTTDLLSLEKKGRTMFENFIKTRLVDKSETFHQPLKRNSTKTFAHLQKTTKMKTSEKNVVRVTAQRNLFGQLLVLSEENNLDMEKVMTYPLGPVPWALATADGLPIKTDKAVLMHKLEDPSTIQISIQEKGEHDVYVMDGNALFHSLTSLPDTFGQLAFKIFCALPKVSKVHFVTDTPGQFYQGRRKNQKR